MKTANDHSLLGHNTFGIDVKAALFAEYADEDELRAFLPQLAGRRVLHIGQGSNLLFTRDFDGVVLHSGITAIGAPEPSADGSVHIRVGGGVVFDDLIVHTLSLGLYGLENLSYIPGEVGASAVQNVGAYGVEAGDRIVRVEAVDLTTGEGRVFAPSECRYAYRQSIFKQELRGRYAITRVTFRLSRTFRPELSYGGLKAHADGASELTAEGLRRIIIDMRRAKLPDPREVGSAGSFFMNPVVTPAAYERLRQSWPDMPHYPAPGGLVKVPAGWLIEQCGWKGRSLGAAGVYARQALVLVNLGGATGADVLRLSDQVRASVSEKFGIDIRPEVNVF